jgi:hypothetical protein
MACNDQGRTYMILTNQNQNPGEAPSDNRYRYRSAAECDICSQLRDCEDGCVNAASDDLPLPAAASRLLTVPSPWMSSLEKCSLCGTYYWCSYFYEWSQSGNEEEAHLRRLPVAEALATLVDGEIYPEMEDLARRGAAYAKMVLIEINRSKLKRDSVEFKSLQSICKEMNQE